MNGVGGRLGFVRSVMVFEAAFRLLEVNHPFFARRHIGTAFVANVQNASDGSTHRAGVLKPLLRRYHRCAVTLRASVVLPQNGPPPIHHLVFYFLRAGCRCVNRALVAAQVVLSAEFFVQLQHSDKHSRHPLGMGYRVLLDMA